MLSFPGFFSWTPHRSVRTFVYTNHTYLLLRREAQANSGLPWYLRRLRWVIKVLYLRQAGRVPAYQRIRTHNHRPIAWT